MKKNGNNNNIILNFRNTHSNVYPNITNVSIFHGADVGSQSAVGFGNYTFNLFIQLI